MVCRHCRVAPVSRPRGLCWGCYYRPGVREKYPARFEAPDSDFNGEAPLPPTPTQAEPGSPEKVAVLAWRAARRFQLWHPDDRRW